VRMLAVLCWLFAAPALADDAAMARAQTIVSGSCFLCHGMQGESATELFPRLAGQNAAYLSKQLANFKSGERQSEVMPRMVAALTPQDMQALGLYFSRQKSPPHPPTDPQLAAKGRIIYAQGGGATEVAACVGCHGERGYGSETLPRLAGPGGRLPRHAAARLRQARPHQRQRRHALPLRRRMTEAEILAVAEYLSALD
jgi:cytochrome c553